MVRLYKIRNIFFIVGLNKNIYVYWDLYIAILQLKPLYINILCRQRCVFLNIIIMHQSVKITELNPL